MIKNSGFSFFPAIVLFCYFLTINSNHADYDLWHRMAIGALFSQNGHLPDHDVFAYTPVKAVWIDHEWGTGVLFYQLGQWFWGSRIDSVQVRMCYRCAVR